MSNLFLMSLLCSDWLALGSWLSGDFLQIQLLLFPPSLLEMSTSQIHLYVFEPKSDMKHEWTARTIHGKIVVTNTTKQVEALSFDLQATISTYVYLKINTFNVRHQNSK